MNKPYRIVRSEWWEFVFIAVGVILIVAMATVAASIATRQGSAGCDWTYDWAPRFRVLAVYDKNASPDFPSRYAPVERWLRYRNVDYKIVDFGLSPTRASSEQLDSVVWREMYALLIQRGTTSPAWVISGGQTIPTTTKVRDSAINPPTWVIWGPAPSASEDAIRVLDTLREKNECLRYWEAGGGSGNGPSCCEKE